jgi:hypothetical protein
LISLSLSLSRYFFLFSLFWLFLPQFLPHSFCSWYSTIKQLLQQITAANHTCAVTVANSS